MSAPIGQDVHAPDTNQQQRLAQQLIACLGRDSAIHVCKVNSWVGILEVILREDVEAIEDAE
jgi:hypothetical protein